ncbi:complement C4 [Narcine bancroftii]|uniref:complement C4 n=1 Tax=Narcine bancroftii TaxID=1343680 RepID=UPI003832179E
MERLAILVWFCTVTAATEQIKSYLITAPNILHLGVKESVTVQVHGVNHPVNVKVYLFDTISRRKVSDDVNFLLLKKNNYQLIKDIVVKPDTIRMLKLWFRKERYISLTAECPELFPTRRMVPILLSLRKGYIFIQTDKPIYTPNEKVRYRIYTLDHYMRPLNEKVRITVYNSKNVQLSRRFLQSQKILSQTFKIPDIAEPGNWRIEVEFDELPMSRVSSEFEVKEFVLPSFKVEILSTENYFQISREDFQFKITARHTYGEPVNGMAYVRFAIIMEGKDKLYLRGLEQQLQVKEGETLCILKTESILQNIRNLENIQVLVGLHLYVAVTVFETASGEMEELEISNIQFVTSPYVIDLSRTPSYFAPHVPFTVLVRVSYPDGSPAARIPVYLEGREHHESRDNGQAILTVSPPLNVEEFDIKVMAGSEGDRTEARKTIHIYQSESKSYLNVFTRNVVHETDRSFSADITAITDKQVDYYYYLILNKGKVLDMGHLLKSQLTKLSLPLSMEMVPSFRLVLYYYVEVESRTEMVANSVWIDVEDVCNGKITIDVAKQIVLPGRSTSLDIDIEDTGIVTLAAVDSAVYILNNKNKLTPSKVFEEMNSYDLGCGFGGGADSAQVLADAGLAFISSIGISKFREGYSCNTDKKRMKRSLELRTQFKQKLDLYTDKAMSKCCKDGMTLIPMKKSCEERAERVQEDECRKVFLDCCQYALELRRNQTYMPDGVARSTGYKYENYFEDIRIRSDFWQSWLWITKRNFVKGRNSLMVTVPDSITTWEIQAVGMFDNKGFCVAKPKPLKVFQRVFLSLRLPYSVKRNEQLEVRAILYNYLDEKIEMTTYMKSHEALCSSATNDQNKRVVTIEGNSAKSVYFSIVPLVIGNIPITIFAYNKEFFKDAVVKNLKVLGEGVLKTEEKSIMINPKGRRSYQILEEVPGNMVPDTPAYLYIRARGEVMGEMVQNSLDPKGIDKLIRLPIGCAEQTSFLMAPMVFAINYLDKSEQWLSLGAERKDEALQHIESGYARILEYKKDDGSYGTWKHRPSSTWLTAFIVKILSIIQTLVHVQREHIQESVLYLPKSQLDDGHFFDRHPVYHREMQGGVGGLESRASLTAFITIAMVHSLSSFEDNTDAKRQVEDSIRQATAYLSDQLKFMKRPYVLAITAYTLALVNPLSSKAKMAFQKLKRHETYDRETDSRHWKIDVWALRARESRLNRVPRASAVEVEATAYALLAALTMKEFSYANAIVKWLTEQRNYGGGFRSTQDTVIALEALSEYSIATFYPQKIDMQFEFRSPSRKSAKILKIQRNNALIQERLTFPLGENISVEVSGSGNGTLTFLKMYQVIEESENACGNLGLEVTMHGEVEYAGQNQFVDYDDQEEWEAKPITRIGWFDLRSRRRRRQAPAPDKTEILYYKVCFWRLSDGADVQEPSGMAVVDITLLSGFEPDMLDLDKISTLSDRYIDSYEFHNGRVLLYLKSVTQNKECVIFGAKQIVPIGLIQPASATLYNYYNPSERCTVFYSAPQKSHVVSKLCQGDVCECAEGLCPKMSNTFSKEIDDTIRRRFACYSPIVDYVYLARVSTANTTGAFNIYTVSITRVVKLSKDLDISITKERNFLKRLSCLLKLKIGKTYLLMGKDGKTQDIHGNMQYILDFQTWIEEVPTERKCSASKYRSSCKKFYNFILNLEQEECQL